MTEAIAKWHVVDLFEPVLETQSEQVLLEKAVAHADVVVALASSVAVVVMKLLPMQARVVAAAVAHEAPSQVLNLSMAVEPESFAPVIATSLAVAVNDVAVVLAKS